MTIFGLDIKSRQRIYVEKKHVDGMSNNISEEEFEDLKRNVLEVLGGPAQAEFEIGLDHWAKPSPVFFTPCDYGERYKRPNHHELWDQAMELKTWLDEKGYICSGEVQWKETVEDAGNADGFWHRYFSMRISNGSMTIWEKKSRWAIYEN